MQVQISAPKIWLATEAVDFRCGINRLSEVVASHLDRGLKDHVYVFHNRARNKLKLLARHHNGMVLLHKQLDKKQFTLIRNDSGLIELNNQQLSWLLAGLDWVLMSAYPEQEYDDYF
jgi:transposase